MGNYRPVDFILNKSIVDEVGYFFWMRLDAVCGGWDFLLARDGLLASSNQKRILQPTIQNWRQRLD